MKVLALDLATTTGFAFRDDSGDICSGTETFQVKRGESPGIRFLRFARWLAKMHTSHHFDVVSFERPHHRGGPSTEVLVGLATRAQEFAAEHDLEHSTVETSTLKLWATGRGNAGKPDMVEAAQKWVPGVESDDEADAILVLAYTESEITG